MPNYSELKERIIQHGKFVNNTIQGIHTDRDTGQPTLKKGKLNLVDLAGSERHGKTGVYRARF